MNKADGSVGEETALENGIFKEERPAGDYTIQIINNGNVVGSIDVTIVVGVDLEGQNVVTNRGLI